MEPSSPEPRRFTDNWKLKYSEEVETFPYQALPQADDLLKSWVAVFPKGTTWVGREMGVPSLIVRIDCVIRTTNGEPKLFVYEVEERPCGIGMLVIMDSNFKERLLSVMGEWPKFSWVKCPERATDDELWLGEGVDLEAATDNNTLLLVRSRPEDARYHHLERRAVSSVRHEGNKDYGVALGLWKRIKWIDDSDHLNGGYFDPPIDYSCVIKPVQGTRCRGVVMYFPNEKPAPHIKDGIVGLEAFRNKISREPMICQPFIPPMKLEHAKGLNAIYRLFLGWSPSAKCYLPLGGMWMARESLRVHGQSDAVMGILKLE